MSTYPSEMMLPVAMMEAGMPFCEAEEEQCKQAGQGDTTGKARRAVEEERRRVRTTKKSFGDR